MAVTTKDATFLCGIVAFVALAAQFMAPKPPGDWYGYAGLAHPSAVEAEALEWMDEPVDRLILDGTSWHARSQDGAWVQLDARSLEMQAIGFAPPCSDNGC